MGYFAIGEISVRALYIIFRRVKIRPATQHWWKRGQCDLMYVVASIKDLIIQTMRVQNGFIPIPNRCHTGQVVPFIIIRWITSRTITTCVRKFMRSVSFGVYWNDLSVSFNVEYIVILDGWNYCKAVFLLDYAYKVKGLCYKKILSFC